MAQELVITSVPRGIKLGRTGFQVVMRTAGMRQDICDQLESLGVYRHLPPGGGPNPACYFHRSVETNAGRLSVLGRVVDAGSDYSNRSNKLAHLIAIPQQELATLRASSPAAVLAAVEPRLARTWAGGPEERSQPFTLHAMPIATAGICREWQQVARDAGWGGVLAEQAARGRPTLVIAPTSSPEWCHRLLSLFQESFALLPPQKRWDVTFDTTVLTAAPVLWRGTYAGSPESAARQPGLLVVDLCSPAAVPPEFTTLPLVAQARHGVQTPAVAPVPGLPPTVPGIQTAQIPGPPIPPPTVVPAGWGDIPAPLSGGTQGIPSAPRPTLARFPGRGHDYGDAPNQAWIKWVSLGVFALLLVVVSIIGGVVVFDVPGRFAQRRAKRVITTWANAENGTPPSGTETPTIDDWLTAYGIPQDPPKENQPPLHKARLERVLSFLTDGLLTKDLGPNAVKDAASVEKLVAACEKILQGDATADDWRTVGLALEDKRRPEEIVNTMIKASNVPDQKPATYKDVTDWRNASLAFARFVDKPRDRDRAAETEAATEIRSWDILLPQDARKHAVQVVEEGFSQPDGDALTLSEIRDAFIKECGVVADLARLANRDSKPGVPPPKSAADMEASNKQLWQDFCTYVREEKPPPWPLKPGNKIDIYSNKDIDGSLDFEIALGGAGEWKPRAEKVAADQKQPPRRREWQLKGVPGDREQAWATLAIQPAVNGMPGTVSLTLEQGAPFVCRYVPIRLTLAGEDQTEPIDLRLGGQPLKSSWQPPEDNEAGTVRALVDSASPVELSIAGTDAQTLVQQAVSKSWRYQLQPVQHPNDPRPGVRIAWDNPQAADNLQWQGALEWRHPFGSPPRECVLVERVRASLKPTLGALSLDRASINPWSKRPTRGGKVVRQGVDERTRLGWDGEKKDFTKPSGSGIPWSDVVYELLIEGGLKEPDGRKLTQTAVQKWTYGKGAKDDNPDVWVRPNKTDHEHNTLYAWRDTAKRYVYDDLEAFVRDEYERNHPKPPKPDTKRDNETEADKDSRQEKENTFNKWRKARDSHVSDQLVERLADTARRYLLEKQGNAKVQPSELAAIYVLRDLDGLMLAKATGVSDQFLTQSLASLLKMTVTIRFTFDKQDAKETNGSHDVDVLVVEGSREAEKAHDR